jgi:hypothetical protein
MAPAAAKEEYVNLLTKAAHLQSQNRVSSSPSPAAGTALVSTGLRLAFDGQQQQQHGSKQMSNALRYSSSSPSLFASVYDELAAQVKQNEEEIDRFIREQVILARPILWFWFSCSHHQSSSLVEPAPDVRLIARASSSCERWPIGCGTTTARFCSRPTSPRRAFSAIRRRRRSVWRGSATS